jgi:hypothetical protein
MTNKIEPPSEEKINNKPSKQAMVETFYTICLQALVLILFVMAGLWTKQLWLAILSLPVILLVGLGWSIYRKSIAGLITLSILSGLSLAAFFYVLPDFLIPMRIRLGSGIAACGFMWFPIWYGSKIIHGKYWWWAVLPGMIILSMASCVTFSKVGLLDILFYAGGGTGIGLLIWGLGEKLLGLLIAGSITATVAPGVAFSFSYFTHSNVLSQIGIMLIWFALGWGLVTISMRVIYEKYVWWPLIPAGIVTTVGLGLYLGGDPVIASTLFGNTGVMGILIFSIYLILFRTRIQR